MSKAPMSPLSPAGADAPFCGLVYPNSLTFVLPLRNRREYTPRSMPFYQRIYSPGQLQFITSSTYRRAALFFSDRFCRCFVQRLEEVRQEWHFLLIGWVPRAQEVRSTPAMTQTASQKLIGPGEGRSN